MTLNFVTSNCISLHVLTTIILTRLNESYRQKKLELNLFIVASWLHKLPRYMEKIYFHALKLKLVFGQPVLSTTNWFSISVINKWKQGVWNQTNKSNHIASSVNNSSWQICFQIQATAILFQLEKPSLRKIYSPSLNKTVNRSCFFYSFYKIRKHDYIFEGTRFEPTALESNHILIHTQISAVGSACQLCLLEFKFLFEI